MPTSLQAPPQSHTPIPVVATEAPPRLYPVAVDELTLGMYVAELDRPWLDTPFLLQGFVVASEIELTTIRKHCRHVMVDPARSRPGVDESVRKVRRAPADQAAPGLEQPPRGCAPGGAASLAQGDDREAGEPDGADGAEQPRRAYRARADVRVNAHTRERFRRYVHETAIAQEPDADSRVQRVLGWLRRSVDQRQAAGPSDQSQRRELLPGWMAPVQHTDSHPMEAELKRANQAFGRGEHLLRSISRQVRSGRPPDLASLATVVDEIAGSIARNPDALMWVASRREADQNVHHLALKVSLYLTAFGRHLGFPIEELRHLATIGLLADIGKAKLPRALLDKPGMLSPSEFGIVKEHVRLGVRLLRSGATLPPQVEQGIAQHHERLDGSGYPKGSRGEQIGLYGRMAGIADCFAALITPRGYANPLAPQDALMNLYQWGDSSFPAPLVEEFVQAVGVYPVGTLVEQSSGEVAAVVARNRVRRLEPRLLVLTDPNKRALAEGFDRDLAMRPRDRRNRPIRIARGLPAGAFGLGPGDKSHTRSDDADAEH